uniref:Peptidase S1 domain-containing protein n=1 Tax=Syphacia muris TaxID=451379 RepID=A0A0N5AXC7_9BILA
MKFFEVFDNHLFRSIFRPFLNALILLAVTVNLQPIQKWFNNIEPNECGESPFGRSLRNLNHYYQVSGSRLVGARSSYPNAWPWTVQMIWFNGAHHCGAALIDRNFIITAAHCFASSTSSDYYRVLLGGHKVGSGRLHHIRNISIHPLYNVEQLNAYDIAIARIDPPAKFTPEVRKICLPSFPAPINKICVVTGWGRSSENGSRPKELKEIHVPILSPFICNDFFHYRGKIHLPSMICAGEFKGGIDACQGDSGGPLFCEIGQKWELHGVVSWGYGCARPNNPGLYSSVVAVVPWIRQQMQRLN